MKVAFVVYVVAPSLCGRFNSSALERNKEGPKHVPKRRRAAADCSTIVELRGWREPPFVTLLEPQRTGLLACLLRSNDSKFPVRVWRVLPRSVVLPFFNFFSRQTLSIVLGFLKHLSLNKEKKQFILTRLFNRCTMRRQVGVLRCSFKSSFGETFRSTSLRFKFSEIALMTMWLR